jgi:hypothetical protein
MHIRNKAIRQVVLKNKTKNQRKGLPRLDLPLQMMLDSLYSWAPEQRARGTHGAPPITDQLCKLFPNDWLSFSVIFHAPDKVWLLLLLSKRRFSFL